MSRASALFPYTAGLVLAGRRPQSFLQVHESLPVWSDNTNPCSRLVMAEPLHTARLMSDQMGTQEQVGSRSPVGCKVVFLAKNYVSVGRGKDRETMQTLSNVSLQMLL